MKFKKLLISASAIAAGSGLLATVLTSCAKASVDEKLKITLDDNGLLYNPGNMGDTYKLDYKQAIRWALTRSNNWAQFKNALAEEVVFNWYNNRMATKGTEDKNTTFRTSYDEWEYQINKDYNDTVQNCKNKYGANWQFYLQNEYLAPYGGTEESYKHAKIVEKVKADFISKVFAKNYFGYLTETGTVDVYPHIYAKATKDVNKRTLWNPENWGKIGFFARAELSFNPGKVPSSYSDVDPTYLAKHPDGDYAAIQDYVFNRWFDTEKPFFADAALFKYSNPKNVAHGKLDEIYNGTRTGVKIPTDKPSEAFPFFGAEGGTAKAVKFFNDVEAANFVTTYKDATQTEKQNGTITIRTDDTEDSQTCLLVSGNQMFTSLFTPYAMACGNLYGRMMGLTTETSANSLPLATVRDNILTGQPSITDDFALLKNFFYKFDVTDTTRHGVPATIGSYLDLNTIYGGATDEGTGTEKYHCPLFNKCEDYNHFYGDDTGNGVRYIANSIEVLLRSETEGTPAANPKMPEQPWVMELNEAGIHVLTIDGYNLVKNETDPEDKKEMLKKLVMYRLMQKQINDNGTCISADLIGDSGKLKTYFSDNFANIVLELATIDKSDDNYAKYNVFRTVESYKTDKSEHKDDQLFLYNIWKDQSLGTAYANLTSYLAALDKFEEIKKCVSTLETANNKIYSYRSKQVTNSKAKEEYAKTVFENGLLTPFAYAPRSYKAAQPGASINNCMYDYNTINRVVIQNVADQIEDPRGNVNGWTKLYSLLIDNDGITKHPYVEDVVSKATVNGSTGFSPQISDAKNKTSNRFWYKSNLVDKFMYSFMGNKSNTANAIKMNAYNYYIEKNDKDGKWFGESGRISTSDQVKQAFASTYARSKLFTGDKNLASYVDVLTDFGSEEYYSLLNEHYANLLTRAGIESGVYADEILNYALWQATVMYLIGSDKTTGGKEFDNFYSILNSKIGDDEAAIVGYMARGYGFGTGTLSEDPIADIGSTTIKDYDFDPNVDNMFDKIGYEGKKQSSDAGKNSKQSTTPYWNVVDKTYLDGTTKAFAGFLGLQTKANNQLDSTSNLQNVVFNNFAKAIDGTHDIADTTTEYTDNYGCWFQFAGSKDSNDKLLTMDKLKVDSDEFDADVWFTGEFACVRKVAKKIREWGTMDDLRTLAKTLADAYDGHSPFADIASGSSTFDDVDHMRMAMLKLLPSTKRFSESHNIQCFKRVTNAEAHTLDTVPSYIFKDSNGKNAYKLILTQINKADAIEKTLTPDYDEYTGEWTQGENSPISPEEFWNILFTIASESTVQQRAITEIVKTAFGDSKLVVYDAQLYNQFDSVWIKDWTKKTLGA